MPPVFKIQLWVSLGPGRMVVDQVNLLPSGPLGIFFRLAAGLVRINLAQGKLSCLPNQPFLGLLQSQYTSSIPLRHARLALQIVTRRGSQWLQQK